MVEKRAEKAVKARKAEKTARVKRAEKKKAEEIKIPEAVEEVKVESVPAPVEVLEKPKKEKKPKEVVPTYYGTGRRKEAVAKVCLKPGGGAITVNGKPFLDYFCNRKVLEFQVTRPLVATQSLGSYDVVVEASGGGIPGQAGAVCLGISRALTKLNPDFKSLLKKEGLLTRDPRMKERKKYGLKRARKAFQYTKR